MDANTTSPEAVDDYLSKLSESDQSALGRVRSIIKTTVPDAVEMISYGIPAFKYQDKPLMYYAAFKTHLSIFPTASPTEALREQLIGFTVSRGTVQFSADHPIPKELIVALLQHRLMAIRHG